jgi:hypothetical protein
LYDGVDGAIGLRLGQWLEVHGLPSALTRGYATRVTAIAAPADGWSTIAGFTNAVSTSLALQGVQIGVPITTAAPAPTASGRIRAVGVFDPAMRSLAAVRIDVLPTMPREAGVEMVLLGIVQRLEGGGRIAVMTAGGEFVVDDRDGLPGALAVGDRVQVQGRLLGSGASANAVEGDVSAIPAAIASIYTIEGAVTAMTSMRDLRVREERVDLSNAQFAAGSAAQVTNGVRLRVVGVAGPGRLIATQVSVLN